MSTAQLEKGSFPVLFFRSAFDLGCAIEKNRDALLAALLELGDLSWFEFLLDRSDSWLDSNLKSLAREKAYHGHVEFVRRKILSDVSSTRESLDELYSRLATDLEGMSAEALAEKLRNLADTAFGYITAAINEYGGPEAKHRWIHCARATLAFDDNEPGPTRCSFRRGTASNPDIITLHIGNPVRSRALRTYYMLDFNLCHEYLSHSFAMWDDNKHLMAEGVLVWLAARIAEPCSTDNVRRRFVEDTLRKRPKPMFGIDEVENAADWFYLTVGLSPNFPKYLLEWAASADHPSNAKRLENLIHLANIGHRNKSPIINRIREIIQNGTTERIHDELSGLLSARVPYLPQTLDLS